MNGTYRVSEFGRQVDEGRIVIEEGKAALARYQRALAALAQQARAGVAAVRRRIARERAASRGRRR